METLPIDIKTGYLNMDTTEDTSLTNDKCLDGSEIMNARTHLLFNLLDI
jgi:hypothetical protein